MDHLKYVPVLKWKMGEYQALSRLDDDTKDFVVPLIEVPPPGYDFEAKQVKKSAAEHLDGFGKRLFSKWQARQCFIDLKHFEPSARVGTKHCISHIFEQVAEHECNAVPVVSLQSDKAFISAVSKIKNISEIGICIRLSASDFDNPILSQEILQLGLSTGTGWGVTDIVVDLCTPAYVPKTVFRGGVTTLLNAIPQRNKARSLVLVGTSYPKTLTDYKEKEQGVPRREWAGYKDFVSLMDEQVRIPTFGDYATASPDLVELDMRFISPYAKLRYTIDDAWYLAVGKAVRPTGFEQYRDMCKSLIKKVFFDGSGFSAADDYIEACAKGEAPTGNLSTWVWVATNRHISKTASDLASFHGL